MLTIKEVKTAKDRREFIEFPLRMYKNTKEFTPPLYGDEMKLLKTGGDKKISESVFFLAEKDGVTVGRIQGIIQKQFNELHGTHQVRFTRFDAPNDTEVSRALFSAVEKWAKERGMTELVGPLGYSDLDREGLLIEGFSEGATFEEQYNFDYYASLVEDAGLTKDVDWLEFELRAPEKKNEMLSRVASRVLGLSGLHIADRNMPKKQYIAKYRDGFFNCLDECYSKLYGTVPITKEAQDEIVSQFMMLLNNDYLVFICDKDEKVVAFGLCMPSIAEAVKPSGGRLTIPTLFRILKAVKNPKVIDLALVAVLPEYQNAGLNAVILDALVNMLESKVEKCETNLNLETNTAVLAQWKHFSARQHKRRRSYKKSI